jgi:Flp pilus assembly protein TadG
LLLAGFAMTATLGFVGLVVDSGILYQQRRDYQNAVDSAALAAAGAARIAPPLADHAAEEYLERNGIDVDDPHVVVTVNEFYAPDQVEVTLTVEAPTYFFKLFGVESKTISVRAVGEGPPLREFGDYAIVALSEIACGAFEKAGTSELNIVGGAILSNSSCNPSSVYAHGSGAVTSEGTDYYWEGGAQLEGGVTVDPPPTPRGTRIENPLAGLPEPSEPTSPDSGGTEAAPAVRDVSGTATLQPGTFWGGLNVTGDVTLEPGIYVMASGGIRTAGGGSLTGDEVLIFNTEHPSNPAYPCGTVDLTGGNDVSLTAMTSGLYAEITIWQDDDCSQTLSFSGGHSGTSGVIYAPGAHIDLAGGGALNSVQFVGQTVEVRGNVDLTLNFTGGFGSSGTTRVYIAE